MKKIFSVLTISFSLVVFQSLKAQQMNDEGMWLLSLIQQNNIDRMNDLGCDLSAGMIYNTDAPCIKDEIGRAHV